MKMMQFMTRSLKQPRLKEFAFHRRNYSVNFKQVTPVCIRAVEHKSAIALVDYNDTYTYKELLQNSKNLAASINKLCSNTQQNRIAYLCSNDVSYIVAQWASWLSGNIAVPLHKSHPTPQLEYYVKDSESTVIISTRELLPKVEPIATKLNLPLLEIGNTKDALKSLKSTDEAIHSSEFYKAADALIIYTSGTTGPPKGVVLTHVNLQAQVETIVEALNFTNKDCVLHLLPLHHTHGIVHALLSPLHVGARLVMLPQFDAKEVWNRLLSDRNQSERVNVMLAVPTMYVKLIEDYNARHSNTIDLKVKSTCQQKMRLMVSGSSALPEPIFNKWEMITGHRILERYGMTEIGLALTNPVHGKRKPGYVGNPIGCVEVCIAVDNDQSPNGYDVIAKGSANGTTVTQGKEGEAGELFVKGPNVFKEYYNNSEATKKTFSNDGWFKTGDTVTFQEGSYKIEGRTSVDIIKSGGYKISALDVERHLLSHPDILEVVVVGVPDPVWGQRVAAVAVMRNKSSKLTLPTLREWCKERMAPYTVPTTLEILDSLPKNAVGKVNKKELVKNVFPENKP